MKRKSGSPHRGWKASAKKYKAEDYTHSVWSGQQYDRPQTQEELTAESKVIIAANLAVKRATKCDDEMMKRMFGSAFEQNETANEYVSDDGQFGVGA